MTDYANRYGDREDTTLHERASSLTKEEAVEALENILLEGGFAARAAARRSSEDDPDVLMQHAAFWLGLSAGYFTVNHLLEKVFKE